MLSPARAASGACSRPACRELLEFFDDRLPAGTVLRAGAEPVAFGLEFAYAALGEPACVGGQCSLDRERAEIGTVASERPLEHLARGLVGILDDDVGDVLAPSAGHPDIHRPPAREMVDQCRALLAGDALA